MAAWRRIARAGRDARVPRADRLQDASRGPPAPSACSSSRCSRASTSPSSRPAEFVHVVTECAKLAFADRDALYGDCRRAARDAALAGVQRRAARAGRRGRVGRRTHPGCGRLPTVVDVAARRAAPASRRAATRSTSTSPTGSGNMISATPSGGWLQSSPVIPRSAGRSARGRRCSGSRKGFAIVAPARRAPADDAVTRACAARRRAVSRLGNARRRPAGAVGDPRLRPPRRSRA